VLLLAFRVFVPSSSQTHSVSQIYGMQFDLGPTPAGQSSVSWRWLSSVLTSIAIDSICIAPISISVTIVLSAVRGRHALDEELERRAQLPSLVHVKAGEIVFKASRADEFVAWLQRQLMWYAVPAAQTDTVQIYARACVL
jgi:hypothetical protein